MNTDVWGQPLDEGSDRSRGIFAITRPIDDPQPQGDLDQVRYLDVKIGSKEYLMESEQVREIIMLPRITFVPNSPRYIEGVINLRGRIIPVINLAKMMGESRQPPTGHARVLVCEDKSEAVLVAMLVDQISGFVGIAKSNIEFDSLPLAASGFDLLAGVSKRGSKLTGILDFRKILTVTSASTHPSSETQQPA